MFHFNDRTYQIIHVHKDAWNAEAFRERYSDVLDRYDYIVGDWGYSQLRLKGFFKEGSSKSNRDSTITHLQDYLNEYCNFGCAYFILERVANPNRAVEPVGNQPGSDEESAIVDSALAKTGVVGSTRETLHTVRPEHRDNRHRYDQSAHRAKQEAMKQAAEAAHSQDGREKREHQSRSSNQRKDQHGRSHGNGGGNAGRGGGNSSRSEHNGRHDSRQDTRHDNRQDSRHDNRQDTRHDNRNEQQGNTGENRGKGRDRRPRGAGPRADKPVDKQAGEHKPSSHPASKNQSVHGRTNPANKSQTKDKTPISQ